MMPGAAVLAPRDRAKIIDTKPDHDFPRMQTQREKKERKRRNNACFPPLRQKKLQKKLWESVLKYRPCAEEGKRGGRKGNKGGPADRPSGGLFILLLSPVCSICTFFSFFRTKKMQPEFEFGKKGVLLHEFT